MNDATMITATTHGTVMDTKTAPRTTPHAQCTDRVGPGHTVDHASDHE